LTHTLRNSGYTFYKENGGTLAYAAFNAICTAFNQEAMAQIVKGKTFDMGRDLGKLSIIRIQRNFQKPAIDWNESLKYKQELLDQGEELYTEETPHGIKWFVYFTTEWFIRFYWEKKAGRIRMRDKMLYSFAATGGERGNKTAAKRHLAEDELNYTDYKLVN
jgi:hypothetical protein